VAIKLHRCSITWIKGPHPCWKVQKALDEQGVSYELVKHPPLRGKRTEYKELTGQAKLPAIQFEDGTVLREESSDLAARIREGRLGESAGAGAGPGAAGPSAGASGPGASGAGTSGAGGEAGPEPGG